MLTESDELGCSRMHFKESGIEALQVLNVCHKELVNSSESTASTRANVWKLLGGYDIQNT